MLASCDQLSTHATTNHMKQCQYFKIETTFYHSPSQTLNIFLNKYVSIWKGISNMISWVRPKDDLDLKPIQRLTRTHGNTHISTLAYVTLYGSLKAFTIHHGLQGVCSFYVKNEIHDFLKSSFYIFHFPHAKPITAKTNNVIYSP